MNVQNKRLGIDDQNKISCISSAPMTTFLFVKIFPIIVYFVMVNNFRSRAMVLFCIFLCHFLEFSMMKNFFGLELVGMKWYLDPLSESTILQFYSKPPPFVPNFAESNLFWIGFFFSLIFWISFCTIYAFHLALYRLFLCSLGLIFQILNLLAFMRCHSLSQKESAKFTRDSLLVDSIKFALASEDESSNSAE